MTVPRHGRLGVLPISALAIVLGLAQQAGRSEPIATNGWRSLLGLASAFADEPAATPTAVIPPTSPLAKIQEGMDATR